MKRALALLLLLSLVSTPSLAYAQASQEQEAEDRSNEAVEAHDFDFETAIVEATRTVVLEDSNPLAPAAVQQVPGRAGPGWRTATGIAMLAGGAAIIWKGVDVYQDEPDRFGRTKNADSYLAWGTGAGIMAFGFITLKGGLEGRGF